MLQYNEIRSELDTLDILLFSGEGFISSAIQLVTNSEWSHNAIVLRLQPLDELYCYESTTLSDVPDLTVGAKVKGVQLVPLSQRLVTYEGKIAWRRIYGNRSSEVLNKMGAFRREFVGRPYEQNQWELLKSALDMSPNFIFKNQPDASSVFCSELIALLFRRLGVLAKTDMPANEFTPADFAGELNFNEGWGAGEVVDLAPMSLED